MYMKNYIGVRFDTGHGQYVDHMALSKLLKGYTVRADEEHGDVFHVHSDDPKISHEDIVAAFKKAWETWTTTQAKQDADKDAEHRDTIAKWVHHGKPSFDYGQITEPELKIIVDEMVGLIKEYFNYGMRHQEDGDGPGMAALYFSDMEGFIEVLNAFRNRQWEQVEKSRAWMETAARDAIPDSLYIFLDEKGY